MRPIFVIHLSPTMLWKASNWHCACQCEASRWTVRLFVDAILVNEVVVDSVPAMRAIAEHWRDSVASEPAAARLGQLVGVERDRRESTPERRAVPRGGRRSIDASRQMVP